MYRNLAIENQGEEAVPWILRRLASAIDAVRAAAAMDRRHRRRVLNRRLIALDDRALRDIGLYRDDIHSLAVARRRHSGATTERDALTFVL